ncbi:MAG TPA: oligopeptide:H+ symporter [Candidatus Nesterenkonia stercoripullorum]|uniref:Oligopeptide:H+ symporter n=1 Tax=Candidatus Nesterenkonia stercoripullorum TaxID=2838701 RepID=A0A9D1UUJ6_9MICC|nr:oligopeptide:H+ symporter [Candidatus Nesterenkonia stercoripullorum]
MNTVHAGVAPATKTFFGHPRMLAHLFSLEVWERFSFYGMQTILAYYMYFEVTRGGLGLDQGLALTLVGAYGGSVYLSTILGAWVADRILGSERVLFYSAIMIMAGHVSLAVLPGASGLALGLALVGIGSGGLKANATSLVGSLYRKDDERRDGGFSIFYMGINLGGFVGPLLTEWLRVEAGFHYGFGAAAVGMAIGLVQYSAVRKNFTDDARRVENPLPRERYMTWAIVVVLAIAAIVAAFMLGWIRTDNLATVMAGAAILAAIAYFAVILSSSKVTAVQRKRTTAFIPLFLASTAFWALYQQLFTLVAVYSEQRLDRVIFGWEMPPGWVVSMAPIFVVVLAGVFAAVWTKMGDRQPSSPAKFGLGLITIGLAYVLFLPFADGPANSTPLVVMALILLIFTIAELLISPIGLSIATKLAPDTFRTQMVALNFLSVSLGTTFSGILAGRYDPSNETPYFATLGIVVIVLGGLLLAGTPAIKRLMNGVR